MRHEEPGCVITLPFMMVNMKVTAVFASVLHHGADGGCCGG